MTQIASPAFKLYKHTYTHVTHKHICICIYVQKIEREKWLYHLILKDAILK